MRFREQAADGRRSARAWGDGGAALIEFALIAPLVIMLIIGSITGGIALSRKNSMTNAVREGARLGATLPQDPTWAAAVQDRVLDLAAGDLTASQVCVKLVEAPSTSAILETPSCALAADEPSISGLPAGECAVLVWAKRTSELEVIVWSRDLTLSADAVNRYERDCG